MSFWSRSQPVAGANKDNQDGGSAPGNEAAAAAPDSTAQQIAPQSTVAASPRQPVSLPTTRTPLSQANAQPSPQPNTGTPATDALNSQIVQAVQLTNAETAAYAASQIATAPNMMITQASGLVAQSAAAYFDGVSKLALASQSVLLAQMTKNIAKENIAGAAEDAVGALVTDLLMGAAAAVAAAAGAIEAESASFAIDKIDESISKYTETLGKRAS
ncbi:hypothetical protein [Pokkaliibacter plantistimulans]|uniref:hypothetical protein n=1 Tax=Pokkaliibacter plantistimulans TaxID=1635171 RepID=UPI0026C72FA5|nr:hypothetical protein [Pokkaliibacter plantistimulans]